MPKKQFLKQMVSLQERIRQHEMKIRTERQRSMPDEGLIRYWEKEIAGFKKNLEDAEKRLRRGK